MRSLLFVPGDRPERFDKACASGADAVILDLEDAVATDAKDAARAAVAGWLERRAGGGPADAAESAVVLRLNAADTPDFAADLGLLRQPGLAGAVLPKAERVDDIEAVSAAAAGGAGAVLPLIETALGVHRLDAIAGARGVQRLVFGTIDFQLDLGIDGEDIELLWFRSRIVLASRVASLAAPVDGVCVALDDAARLERETRRARALGFGAKLCIHPRQVETVNRAFAPTAGQLAWARRVVDAIAASGGAAVRLDGRMIDRPVVLQAERMLRAAGPAGD